MQPYKETALRVSTNAKQGSPKRSSHGGLFVGCMTRYGILLVGCKLVGRRPRLLPGGWARVMLNSATQGGQQPADNLQVAHVNQ
jgi:hypothetical protein